MKINEELLAQLVNTYAISGHETAIRNLIKNELNSFNMELIEDNLGSLIYKVGNKGPKIMLASHMDEVGFIVRYIDENGFIYFLPVGGWWNQVLLSQKVAITTSTGQVYEGVIGSKPPHVLKKEERDKPVNIEDMFIDLGVNNKQEVLDLGIAPGDMICPIGKYQPMVNPNYVLGKAFDNRIGCYILIELLKAVANLELDVQLYGVFTTQEEIGLRGATTSSNLINPDIAIAVDTGIAGDTPKMTNQESMSYLGKGPQIIVLDATTFGHVKLREYMLNIANKNDIAYQLDFTPGGGTDAGKMHLAGNGALGMSLSIATRYIHSHLSVINLEDVKNMIQLLTIFITNMNQSAFEGLLV